MNRVEVIQVFEDAIKNNDKFIGLMIEKEGARPEISIIPGQNFIRKKRYLLKAYDNNMRNNRDRGLKITHAWPINSEDVYGVLPSGG